MSLKIDIKVKQKKLKKEKSFFVFFGFLLSQEEVGGHPDGRLGVGAVGFLLGIPETLATG